MIILNLYLFIYYYYINFYFSKHFTVYILKLKFFNFYNYILGLNNNMFSFFFFNFFNVNLDNTYIFEEKLIFFNIWIFIKIYFLLNFFNLFILFFFFISLLLIFFRFFIYKKLNLNIFLNIFFFGIIYNNLVKYIFLKTADYNFVYQIWYKFARNQKNTYLSLKFRLVYLTKKFVQREFLNNNIFKDQIQEYFILKRKNFFDSHFKPIKIRKFVPLINLKKKFYTKQRRDVSFKGLLFFYLKDYEDRINKKEEQQKILRIYEGIFGIYINQELLKKTDQKQARFVRMKLHRD
jgi:hypothetical protein